MYEYKVGSCGSEIKDIQQQLAKAGLYKGKLDGDFGGGTESAVKALQFQNNLPLTGNVDEKTWCILFQSKEMPVPALFKESLEYRCLALTGTFETNSNAPECFCAINGDFDDQGISFGVLQWNFGQGTLQKLLKGFVDEYPEIASNIFHDELDVIKSALAAPQQELMGFAKSIQHPVKHTIFEPWAGMAKSLGRTVEFQHIQVKYAAKLFKQALMMCQEYGLSSQRAAMLMFDICVQNGSISDLVKARIIADFNRLTANLTSDEKEIQKMQIIANRRAEAANSRWVEDVRARKLCIANGIGTVHGMRIDLANQFNLTLAPI